MKEREAGRRGRSRPDASGANKAICTSKVVPAPPIVDQAADSPRHLESWLLREAPWVYVLIHVP